MTLRHISLKFAAISKLTTMRSVGWHYFRLLGWGLRYIGFCVLIYFYDILVCGALFMIAFNGDLSIISQFAKTLNYLFFVHLRITILRTANLFGSSKQADEFDLLIYIYLVCNHIFNYLVIAVFASTCCFWITYYNVWPD